ncbi:hypothetical protein CesoFtcFv8_024293 [Champsocephalus esox]|uniref:FIP-RBD domain-containing protein n=1 Tax=Champsocephalus esox TaxID=159716 RepID=A0AAN8GID5_9TELE|nr:hypothetical protein CesoFtcFv8_024293 [Champsocephalus esox]
MRREQERAEEEQRKREEEGVVRRQEEEHEKKRRREEQEERQRKEEDRIRMEEERTQEERRRQEESARREEQCRSAEKIRVEEERSIREGIEREEAERRQRETEEMVRRQQEEREEQERRQREEEERMKTEEEETTRREKETLRQEEERRRIEAEEKRKREERIRMEEEMRKKEEERKQLAEEKRKLEEQEKFREEEERRQVERSKKEKEERLLEEEMRRETKRIEEEEKVKREEEKIRREQKERGEEARKLEEEKATRKAEQRKKKDASQNKHKVAVEIPAEVPSNPFDEKCATNPFEEDPDSPAGADGSADKMSAIQQRVQSAAPLVGSKSISTDEKDPISAQREKRLAPQPPGRNRDESQKDGSAQQLPQITKKSSDKDIKTISVLPQRSVQMIAPISRPSTDAKNTQSSTQSSAPKDTSNEAKHSKRPALLKPLSVEEEPSSKPKITPSSDGSISHKCLSVAKQVPIAYGLNPFEEDIAPEDEAAPSSETESGQRPSVASQAAGKDDSSQTKIKPSKARAPLPSAAMSTLINQNEEGEHVTGATHASDPKSEAQKSLHVQDTPLRESQPATVQSAAEEAGGKKGGAPVPLRRLQPVKPLNPLEQQSLSVVQGERDAKSSRITCEGQEKTKVDAPRLKGPYSQLTQEELISLVLKQETKLLDGDKKISELELYIDHLLVRIIEEKPSILMSLNSAKKAA